VEGRVARRRVPLAAHPSAHQFPSGPLEPARSELHAPYEDVLSLRFIGYVSWYHIKAIRGDLPVLTLILAAALTGATCANPSIVSARIQSVTTNGGLNHYTIAITVQNQGSVRQPGNLLQSVDVFQDGLRVDRIGLQPLSPKQSQKVTYSFDRAADAGNGTTNLTLTLDFNGRSGKNVDCEAGIETVTLAV